ncbi:MAG: hypothetical protein HKP30_16155 [Myxococcales bacterium]|nr:hypothetical protein [Myxococcales bacterium]
MSPDAPDYPDAHVAELARLFREHPAWREAARRIRGGATSSVWFSHRAGEPWHLARSGPDTVLLPGAAPDPDFVFRFTPASIGELAAAGDTVGDFAVRLFELMIEPDPERRVALRIVAAFPRLVWRGYVDLLFAAGPRLLAFAARHGVTGLGSLRRAVNALRRQQAFDWESERAAAKAQGGRRT